MNWFSNLFKKKEISMTDRMSIYASSGGANWSVRNYGVFANEGYGGNPIVYRCVDLRASFIDNLDWQVFNSRGNLISNHPLSNLLKRPNKRVDSNNFFYDLCAYTDISGNGYIFVNSDEPDGIPQELILLRPDRIQINFSSDGIPSHYTYIPGFQDGMPKNQRIFPINFVDGSCDIIQWKTFNPLEEFYGLSPLVPAGKSVDCFNEGMSHIKAMLENRGTASGIFTTEQPLQPDSQVSLRNTINEFKVGGKRAGEDMILHSGLSYQRVGGTPQELEMNAGQTEQARYIAQSLGVPEQLVGIPGSQTYANYAEARLAFVENTMLPLAGNLEQLLNQMLVPRYGKNIFLKFDRSNISALEERRASTLSSLKDVSFLTVNEKRRLAGFESIEGGDVLDVSPVKLDIGVNRDKQI